MATDEAFALFRWRALCREKYLLDYALPQLVHWPILGEWPPEKVRRAEHKEAGQ